MISNTIIKWQQVNMRATEKNLPEEHKRIIYYDNGIYDATVIRRNNKLCITTEFKTKEIKTGLVWCYQVDILQPEEI